MNVDSDFVTVENPPPTYEEAILLFEQNETNQEPA